MQIQVISVSKPEWKEKPPKAKWQEVTLTYSAGGKTTAKKFLSFDPIFNKIKEMEDGEQYDVTMEKEGDYWKWKEVVKMAAGGAGTGQEATKQVSRPSTYETPEERAKKQLYIIRQSAINYALDYSKAVKALKSKEEVTDLAQYFISFVLNGDAMEAIINMEDDIPA
jgi:hypothetical protein